MKETKKKLHVNKKFRHMNPFFRNQVSRTILLYIGQKAYHRNRIYVITGGRIIYILIVEGLC